jgi:hypothetical protein
MARAPSSFALVIALLGSAAADPKPAPPPALTGADCEPIVKKMWAVLVETMKKHGQEVKETDRPTIVAMCKQGVAKDPHDPELTCVKHAADEAAVRVCVDTALNEPPHTARKSEAMLQLNKLGKNLKTYFITESAFPKGKAARLPEKACCAQPDHRCAVTKAWEKDATWAALDFQIDEPNQFQYAYESDGATVKATAVGDPTCSGKPLTYTLEAKSVGGNVQLKISEPPK